MGLEAHNIRDPGLQPERTELSWRRTAFSMLVPALLALRGWFYYGDWPYAAAGLLLLSCALLILVDQRCKNQLYVSFSVVGSSLALGLLFIFRLFIVG
ncbi:DUF202 domain-containing protein [Salmonella bongori]|uniref:DUF202 domain-containing protein n=1 Tax=Salmonella bongori TaxID=54736 RepID=UPI00049A93B5|nr:DUF202 domain-containing protein [Salmonella bongori]AID27599.1 hypothetical protein N643_16235 [Salmonella bongori serovar 48:z41:-- str. RKS3044]EIU0392516.1 DUF202 domain-containing protein [Salmonella bongori]